MDIGQELKLHKSITNNSDVSLNNLHRHGTYAGLYLSAHSQQDIFKIIIGCGIPRSKELGDLHCTVLYSKAPYPDALWYEADLNLLDATPIGYEAWTGHDGKRYLVMRLESALLESMHEVFLAGGATHSFDEFKPHVTITNEWDDRMPVSSIPVPNEPITFSRFEVSPLEE